MFKFRTKAQLDAQGLTEYRDKYFSEFDLVTPRLLQQRGYDDQEIARLLDTSVESVQACVELDDKIVDVLRDIAIEKGLIKQKTDKEGNEFIVIPLRPLDMKFKDVV